MTVEAKALLDVFTSYADAQAGDLYFAERGGVAGKKTHQQLLNNFTEAFPAMLGPAYAPSQVTTSGTAFDFVGIPSWATQITVIFSGVSLSGTDHIVVQIGGGAIETTGYIASSVSVGSTTTELAFTTGFGIRSNGATEAFRGTMRLTRLTPTSLTWAASYSIRAANGSVVGGGDKTLSAALDRLRITRTGTNTFDQGEVSVSWQ